MPEAQCPTPGLSSRAKGDALGCRKREGFTMRGLMVTFVLLTALACGGTATEPSSEQHGLEGGGGEPGESATQYSLTDTAVETRSGVRLTMRYDAAADAPRSPRRLSRIRTMKRSICLQRWLATGTR